MWPWREQAAASRRQAVFWRYAESDRRLAARMHRAASWPAVLAVLRAVSWLGDGPLWYAAIVVLPWLDWPGWKDCLLDMLLVGAANVALNVALKHHVRRARPFVDCPGIRARARAIDRFSFPSGHVMHAVAFAIIIARHYPELGVPLWLFVALVAASRVVLGLHYPSDVLAGASLGAGVALLLSL